VKPMKCAMLLSAVAIFMSAPASALAAGPAATTLRLALPPAASLGENAQVQAQLLDAAGKPIPGARLFFSEKLGFLESAGDAVVADALTNASGIANAEIDLRTEGTIAVTVAFQGDAQHAASSASGSIDVSGGGQLYSQNAGVKLPGLNEPPGPAQTNAALFERVSALWPALSGWPIALALMIIWSFYASVVYTLFRIVGASRKVQA
jgi:hypothetical protein